MTNKLTYGDLNNLLDVYIPDLDIYEQLVDDEVKYGWTFRCADSNEYVAYGFDSQLEALIHFTKTNVELLDNLLQWKP